MMSYMNHERQGVQYIKAFAGVSICVGCSKEMAGARTEMEFMG